MSKITPSDVALAFHNRLSLLTPKWNLKKLGVPYTPVASQAYQIGTVLPATPVNVGAVGVYTRQRFIYTIQLFYPASEMKTAPLYERAQLVADWFYPRPHSTYELISNFTKLLIDRPPQIHKLMEWVPHHMIVVDIFAQADDCGNI